MRLRSTEISLAEGSVLPGLLDALLAFGPVDLPAHPFALERLLDRLEGR